MAFLWGANASRSSRGLEPFVGLRGQIQVSAQLPYCLSTDPDKVEKTLYNHGLTPFGLHFRGCKGAASDSSCSQKTVLVYIRGGKQPLFGLG